MFTFFFTEASPFSQWFACQFVVNGVTYRSAEQYMMFGKAQLFSDEDVGKQILEAAHPKTQKALGRKVKNFDPAVWERERMRIVKEGNRAKFTQNEELLFRGEQRGGTTLVEASPFDRIWGIGLSASDARAQDPKQWKGKNLLGIVLTELRDELLASTGAGDARQAR